MNDTPAFIKYEKRTRICNILSVVSTVLILLGIIAFAIGAMLDENGFSTLSLFMIVFIGIFFGLQLPLFFNVRNRYGVIKRYRAYVKVLMRNPHNSVVEISEACDVDPKAVVSDFDMMNKLGFFEGLSIDVESSKVEMFKEEKMQKFVCPICGGTSEIKTGDEQVCAFCGAIKEKEINETT